MERKAQRGEKKIKYTYVLKSFTYITRRLREARLEKKKNAFQLFFLSDSVSHMRRVWVHIN